MKMAVHRRGWPKIRPSWPPSTVYFRVAGWIAWTGRGLFQAGVIDGRGLLAALKGYHLISRLGIRAWRAERRRLLR